MKILFDVRSNILLYCCQFLTQNNKLLKSNELAASDITECADGDRDTSILEVPKISV